jgi:hypothetical protein
VLGAHRVAAAVFSSPGQVPCGFLFDGGLHLARLLRLDEAVAVVVCYGR